MANSESRRFCVAANRLPVRWNPDEGTWETSPGGLVAALAPTLRQRAGTWVGWSGRPAHAPQPFEHDGIQNRPVKISGAEIETYYRGFCNATIWPLYHNAIRTPEYHRHWWRPYRAVNRRFANAVAGSLEPDGVAWVHDYHLQLVPRMLRERDIGARIGFFLHIPFPPQELFSYLPWRREVLRGLLGADVLAFQTRASVANFADCAQRYVSAVRVEDGLEFNGRFVRLQWAPIAIDTGHLERLATSEKVRRHARSLRERLGPDKSILLGVDRLDYTKGIANRLRALETFFERFAERAQDCTILQVAVPTREEIADYSEMREQVERLVGQINGRYGRPGYTPITYLYRTLSTEDLVACYRAADVMMVTPLCDGMNLVAKEYVATRFDDTGVLVLSEFAGAAADLREALVINPNDLNWFAETLDTAVAMSDAEAAERMTSLRRQVRAHDVFAWSARCLEALDLVPEPSA